MRNIPARWGRWLAFPGIFLLYRCAHGNGGGAVELGAMLMVTGVLRRHGDRYVVEVSPEEVERLHLQEGEAVALELLPVGSDVGVDSAAQNRSSADDETAYLLRSPRNRERLLSALAQADRGEGITLSLADIRKELGLAERA